MATDTTTTVVETTITTENGSVGTLNTSGSSLPGGAVPGGTGVPDAPRAVAVYRTQIPNSRVYVGMEYEQAKLTQGSLYFAGTGDKVRHPHNREAVVSQYGELCVWDSCLIKKMDEACHNSLVSFWRVIDPQPIQ